jgi:hypothetical protein
MPTRFYFNTENDHAELDAEGTDLSGLAEARAEAIKMMGEMLRDSEYASSWNGRLWRVWVSDRPRGDGHVLFTLHLSAIEGA